MNISGNTILITGGGSGIGRALAEAFHAKGNQVIVAGRRPGALDETTAANPGMRSAVLDIEDRDAIPAFAARIAAEFPTLNVLVNNAGIMRRETLTARPVGESFADLGSVRNGEQGFLLHPDACLNKEGRTACRCVVARGSRRLGRDAGG